MAGLNVRVMDLLRLSHRCWNFLVIVTGAYLFIGAFLEGTPDKIGRFTWERGVFLRVLLSLGSFLLWIEAIRAGPCDRTVDEAADLPGVMMSEALARPHKFIASDGVVYYLSDLWVPDRLADGMLSDFDKRFALVMPVASKSDRWGRKPAILIDQNLSDLTEKLVERGLAMVRPQFRAFNCLKFLLNLENEARREKLGLWTDKTLISDGNSIGYEKIGGFEVVEAKLISVGRTRSKTYLNFGERWTEDLTGIIQRGKLSEFSQFGHDLATMKGKHVRLRGVVQLNRGPLIELGHPAQLELLD